MTKPKPTKSARIAKLERRLAETEAQLIHVYHFASHGLRKARGAKGGAVIVRMHWLGGTEVCPPFAIKDSPSDATIDALLADLARSFETAVELRP